MLNILEKTKKQGFPPGKGETQDGGVMKERLPQGCGY
jgi:hypothetical protein